MSARFAKPRAIVLVGPILLGALLSGPLLSGCGGSSSETPYPLEPVPHSVKPLKHNQGGSGGGPPEANDQN